MIGIQINDHGTVTGLQTTALKVSNPTALLKALGARGVSELKRHFNERDTVANKLGGRRSNFWWSIAKATTWSVEGNSRAVVSVTDYRFAQKVFGGPIRPKRADALTIPVAPEAYDRSVSVFEHETGIKLFLLRKKGGAFSRLLAGQLPDKSIKVYYVLSKGVNQDPDPEALPPKDKFQSAILEEADSFLRREIAGRSGANAPNE